MYLPAHTASYTTTTASSVSTLIPCFPISLPQNGLKSHSWIGSGTKSPRALFQTFPQSLIFQVPCLIWIVPACVFLPRWGLGKRGPLTECEAFGYRGDKGYVCAQGIRNLGKALALQSRCVEEHIMYESLLSAPKIYWRYCQYLTSNWGLPWGLLQSVPSLAHALLRKLAGNDFQGPAVLLLLLHLQESRQE